MSKRKNIICPACSYKISVYDNPVPTVDIIIETMGGFVLINRKNRPLGWAIPGGFVDAGESVVSAAIREAKEETSLDVKIVSLLGVYSDPSRDPRQHTISTVFVAKAEGNPVAADDAKDAGIFFSMEQLPEPIVFDHKKILSDYFKWRSMSKEAEECSGLFFT